VSYTTNLPGDEIMHQTPSYEPPADNNDPFTTLSLAICYGELIPHLKAWQSAQDPYQGLALMEPYYFRRFLDNAVQGFSHLAVTAMCSLYQERIQKGVAYSPQVAALSPLLGWEIGICQRLLPLAEPFYRVLDQYTYQFTAFHQHLQGAPAAAEMHGTNWGLAGASLGALLLGPLGAVLGAIGGGWFADSMIRQGLQKAAQQLEAAFYHMLHEYENTCNRLLQEVMNLLTNYWLALESALSGSSPPPGGVLPG
jgi:hypothetical protein